MLYDDFHLTIIEENQILMLISDDGQTLGSKFDNEAQRLVFKRPIGRESDNLLLYFKVGTKSFGPIFLGTENNFLITNTFTTKLSLDLQIAFNIDSQEERSNILTFILRESLKKGDLETHPKSDTLLNLAQKSFTSAEYNGVYLIFKNMAGDIVEQIEIVAGGEGAKPFVYSFLVNDWAIYSTYHRLIISNNIHMRGLKPIVIEILRNNGEILENISATIYKHLNGDISILASEPFEGQITIL